MNETNYNRRFKSPVFPFKNSAEITAGSTFLVSYHDLTPATQKYGSFNNLVINNISNQNIILYPNQDRNNGIFIANSSTKTIGEEAVSGTTSILIENVGSGTINAEEIRINVWKDKQTFEDTFQRLHKKFFGKEETPQLSQVIINLGRYTV